MDRVVRRSRGWVLTGVVGLSLGLGGAWASPAFGQAADDEQRTGGVDRRDRDRLREMTPEERREFFSAVRRDNDERRIRRQLEAQGFEGAALEAELARRLGDDGEGQEEPEAPVVGDGADAGAEPGAVGEVFEGEDRVEFAFAEPVSLSRITEIIGQALGINIFSDPALENERIAISAPVSVEKDRLLPLLSTLLEDRGFVLTRAGDEFYRVGRNAGVDLRGGELATTRIIATPNLRPSALVSVVQSVFTGSGNAAAGGAGRAGGGLTISPIDELSLLIATGGAAQLNRLEDFLERLDEESDRKTLHMLPVQNVSAGFARSRMVELHGRISTGGGVGVTAGARPAAPRPAAAGGGSLSNLSDHLYVHSGNTLLFRGTATELPEVTDLLRVVDQLSPLRAERYQAGSVTSEVVDAAAALGLGAAEEVEGDQGAGARGFGPSRPGEDGDVSVGESRFLVDSGSGSFVYFGTDTQHAVVADLVERFRKDMIDNGTQIRVYRLVYAQAAPSSGGAGGSGTQGPRVAGIEGDEGVAALLEELIANPETRQDGRFLPGGRDSAGADGGDSLLTDTRDAIQQTIDEALGGTRLVATEENTVIVADPARNQVLIKAPALAHRQFERIIQELDQRQRQVNLDIEIVTITLDDDFTWSTATDLNFGDVAISSLFGAGAPAAVGDSVADVINVPAANPGFTAGVIDNGEVPFAFNTLRTIGDLRSTSRPNLLVSDNQTARVESIEEVPFAETTQGANTTTTGQGGVAEAGTLVEITPRISDSGEITLAFNVELSAFSGPAANGLQPPALRNIFGSQVTLPNNSTIIVGGFESTRESRSESGIPLLMDIPLVGNLFKTVTTDEARTAVFVFITPTILDDEDDLGLRLLTEGPLKDAGLDDGMPEYGSVVIPVNGLGAGPERTPRRVEWFEEGEDA